MYWDFLNTHRVRFSSNLRVRQQLTTLDRFGPEQVKAISQTAAAHRRTLMPLAPGWDFDDDAG